MTAPFGRDLIFDHDASKAGARIATNGALDIHRVPIAGVAVANARNRQATRDLLHRRLHLAE